MGGVCGTGVAPFFAMRATSMAEHRPSMEVSTEL